MDEERELARRLRARIDGIAVPDRPIRRRRRSVTELVIRFGAMALLIALAAGVGSALQSARRTGDPSALGSPAPRSSPLAATVRREDAISFVRGLAAEVKRVDRIEAKLMTSGELLSAAPDLAVRREETGAQGLVAFFAEAPVWVVAVSGDIVPAFAKAATRFTWAVWVIDPEKLEALWMNGSGQTTWPPFFDALLDHPAGPPAMATGLPSPSPRMSMPAQARLGSRIDSVAIGMNAESVLRALGEPRTRTVSHGLGTPEWDYASGLTVYFTGSPNGGTVWRLRATAPYAGATAEGVRIGSTDAEARAAYASFEVLRNAADQLVVSERAPPERQRLGLNLQLDASGRVARLDLYETFPVSACARPGLQPDEVVRGFFELLNAARTLELWRCLGDAIPDRVALATVYAETGGTTQLQVGPSTQTASGAVAVEVRVRWRNVDAFGAWGSEQTKWMILRRQLDSRWAIESVATALAPAQQ